MANTWTGTTWFIEGDISDCFGSLDHEVMLEILAEKIHDNRFLRLLRNMLQAGYLEDWVWNATLSGAPQGGVLPRCSPTFICTGWTLLSRQVLIPEYTRGERGQEPRLPQGAEGDRHGLASAGTAPRRGHCVKRLRSLPSKDPARSRLPAAALLPIRRRSPCSGSPDRKPKPRRSSNAWRQFLRDELRLELSEEKTLITHARTGAARFLGYEITVQHNDKAITNGQRSSNGDRQAAGAHRR